MSSGSTKAADLFEDLWRQLGECHQNTLQELEAKVTKLKKDRCLDAQRLEVFYNRNQQLKEQNRKLQDAISHLEERLRTGECDQCSILEDNLKNSQDKNLQIISRLKNERELFRDENRKLLSELHKFNTSLSDQEDGIIPDSPVLQSSLPVANKLKKHKKHDKTKRVRYAEIPLPRQNGSIFSEPDRRDNHPVRAEVLVPNTCEMDASQITEHVEDPIAETCALELYDKHPTKTSRAESFHSSSQTAQKPSVGLKSDSISTLMDSPDSTAQRSPSLLVNIKGCSDSGSASWSTKRKKNENHRERDEGLKKRMKDRSEERVKMEPSDCQVHSVESETCDQRADVSYASPVFKKPNRNSDCGVTGKRSSDGEHQRTDKHTVKVEPTWSIDPALALSEYGQEDDEEQKCAELADTDCTWVSHSLLQHRGLIDHSRGEGVTGLGKKANDSLDLMFDASACGEYKSFISSHLGRSQLCEDEEEEEEEEKKRDDARPLDSPEHSMHQRKAGAPSFAHVAVIRKKDERRKLKGTTCKECDTYYADLPEEERNRKLASCSRHRFLYIPPSTPENFWEVGFPSTQTCIDRGYIHEEKNPESRSRRRNPLSALFSPKRRKQESRHISP